MVKEIERKTFKELSDGLNSGDFTSEELCGEYLNKIKKTEPSLNAFLSFDKDHILKQSKESDKRRKQGKILSDYDGIPISLKDLISEKNQPCRCASRILENYEAAFDATAVENLRSNGFIIFGRNNMDEFAMGSSCENSAYQTTKNPWDLSKVPGGSSGGSAAAVSSGEIVASLGSDTGGSVRQPAAYCGVVGLKPSYGRISRYGLVSYASSLDQIGPITKNVYDSAVLLDKIGGKDRYDSTSLPDKLGGYESLLKKSNKNLSGVKIGIPSEYLEFDNLKSEIKESVNKTIGLLKELGAEIVNVNIPHAEYAVAAYYIIATAEASANLARFDGIRYGRRDENSKDLKDLYFKTRGNNFGEEVKRRILLGTFSLSSGYYDAYYLKAQKVRTLIQQDFNKALKKCDVIFSPTTPNLPFNIGEVSDPIEMYLTDVFTVAVNLAGNCALNIPIDKDEKSGLPIGAQFIGPFKGEGKIISVANIFENNRKIKEFIPNI